MPERLDQNEIVERLTQYEGWEQQAGLLTKLYDLKDFREALQFVNDVGHIAEELNHHPDIVLQNYDQVILRITTHEVGGITAKDFEFVGRVEGLPYE